LALSENLWTSDPDPEYGMLETSLYALGSSYLHNVHSAIHKALDLPKLPKQDILDAYRVVDIVAKAPGLSREDAWNKAARIFSDIKARGTPVEPAVYRSLADAASEKWYAEGRLETRAQKHAVASYLLGQMKAGKPADIRQIDDPRDHAITYAAQRGVEHMQSLSDKTRHALRQTLYNFELDRTLPDQRASQLLAQFGILNRDWRRVAVTENALNRSNGFIGALEPGEKVKWSASGDACKKCKALDNKVFTVVDGEKPDKDPLTEIWIGKTSRGHDLLEYPAIPGHPNCRCNWVVLMKPIAEASTEIEDRIKNLLDLARQ
jgi:hypothetical protein